MSYVVLARKWRPMSFRDLVGQDHVAQTLGNAIAQDRVAHAFLFTGVRGVGKTTSARILAKALNCMGEDGSATAPTVDPCLVCPACVEIAKGTDLDVQEIDGASYNGVDEVRRLQDSLPYRPSRDRYKIVIVDEVHMLSQAAWNAFLKTLEEPPSHVKFIFATTEVHKVPITILSRVQRFDFKMISARVIAQRLRFVLGEESISADDEAVSILARQAAGSMRDAMSLLDQVIAFGGNELRGADVARVLGVASSDALEDIAQSILEKNAARCLSVIADLAEQGYDLVHVARDLLALFRDLVVLRVAGSEGALVDHPGDALDRLKALASTRPESDLIRLHQSFSKNFDDVVRGSDPRAGLEMQCVQLALRPDLLSVDELLHRLAHLERRITSGAGSTASSRAAEPKRAPPPRASAKPMASHSERDSTPSGAAPRAQEEAPEEVEPDPAPEPEPAAAASAPAGAPPEAASAPPERAETSPETTEAPRERAETSPGVNEAAAPPPRPITAAPDHEPSARPSGESKGSPREELTLEASAKDEFLISDHIRAKDPHLAALFDQLVPLPGESAAHLIFAFDAEFLFAKEVSAAAFKGLVQSSASEALGREVTTEIICRPISLDRISTAAQREQLRKLRHEQAIQDVRNHPKIEAARRILNAEITYVRPAER